MDMVPNYKLPTLSAQLVLVGFLVLALWGAWTDGHPRPHDLSTPKPTATHGEGFKLRICGPRIKDAISMICRHKAAYAPPLERVQRDVVPRRPYRAVVNDCCGLGCKVSELEKYCGKPLDEDPRLVSLQDFLMGLVEFFQQTGPRDHRPLVPDHFLPNAWEERSEITEERLDDSDEEGRKKGLTLNSDETARDKEEERRSGRFSAPLVQLDYKGPSGYKGHWIPTLAHGGTGGRMEEHTLRRGTEIAVIVPEHRN